MSKKFQETSSYMDAVNVKIAEEYKPPPKINLLMTHDQRLKLNKQIQDNLTKYDFSMEINVLKSVREWKKNRLLINEQRKIKLDNLRTKKEEEISDTEDDNTESNTSFNKETYNSHQYPNGMLLPTKVQSIPIDKNSQKYYDNVNIKSPFNISEFEADTSSPFDNLALKSINEVEELAKVLKIEDKIQPATSLSYNVKTLPNYNDTFHNTSAFDIQNCLSKINNYINTPSINSFQSSHSYAPYSLKEKSSVDEKKVSESIKKDNLPNPFDNLPKILQDLSKNISLMGFPLSRVARTCKAVGNDNKKVLDHLLAMSELLDLGFPEDRVSEALLQCDNDRDKALEILIS